MGQAFELSKSSQAGAAKIQELHDLWGRLYERLALHPVSGQEVLRVAATIKLGDEAGKPLPAETALEKFRSFCNKPDKTVTISNWLYDVADQLVKLQGNIYREPVTRILQARVLAVALMLCETLTKQERDKCLEQWERVTFRIYGLSGKDARTKVGDYVRLAKNIINRAQGASRYSEIMDSLRELGADHPVGQAVEMVRGANCYDGFAEETRYVLWRYEEFLAREAGADINKEARDQIWKERSATDSIEHVFPQNPEPGGAWDGKLGKGKRLEDHVHRIGNLILLPQPLNEEAKRQGFAAKKNVYSKSEGLRSVREVMQKRDWGLRQIEEREANILRWAKNEWADLRD